MNRYVASNRALWDELAPIHERSEFYDVDSFVAGATSLEDWEAAEVGDVAGKSLLHLQCHFGLDTLSWARLGARVTGADFSPAAVDIARRLARTTGLDARFVCSDLYELPSALGERFDVVYTSHGVLGWLPDVDRWGEVVARFVAPGGVFYVSEFHPFAWVFDDDESAAEPRVRYPYWPSDEPIEEPVRGSYADRSATVATPFAYGWPYTLGGVVTALAAAGLRIEFVHERPFTIEGGLPFVERRDDGRWWPRGDLAGKIPLLFSLRAHKPR